MAKKTSIKKRLEIVFEIMKSSINEKFDARSPKTSGTERSPEIDRSKATRQFVRRIARPIDKAFTKAGLDIKKQKDWKTLVILFCVAIYGGRDAGQPKRWSKKKLRKLRGDISNIKAEYPGDSELDCCKRLLRGRNNGRYNKVESATTLRRVLQTAKRLESNALLIGALKDPAVASDLTEILNQKPRS